MKSITSWKKEYELGNHELDTQHQSFLAIIKKLKDAYENKLNNNLVLGYVVELHRYAAYHFISEENFMLAREYPGYKQHKILHDELLKELADNIIAFKIEYIDVEKLIDFSLSWFIKHTTTIDKKIIEYVNQSKK